MKLPFIEELMTINSIPRRPIIVFVSLSAALLWIPFFGVALTESQSDSAQLWKVLLGIMGPYSPLIAALITRTIVAREGFIDAHLSFRATHWRYWLLAVLFPFIWNTVQDLSQLFLGFGTMEWSQFASGLYRVPINLFGGLLIFIGEEFGWRSYLLEKLRPLGRLKALALSSLVWSLWHAPFLFVPNPNYGSDVGGVGAILSILIFICLGFIFGWLYLESGSVWPCVLMHSYNNLIAFKLFREAWTVNVMPSLLQNALMALPPILLIGFVLAWKDGFSDRKTTSTV